VRGRKRQTFLIAALFFLALGFSGSVARAASFTASLDRDAISLGESATLSLAFQDGQPKNVPMPSVPDLRMVESGNQSGFSVVNGAMSSTLTLTFTVVPQRTGEFIIPAITVDVNGQSLSSRPIKLTVTRANAPSAATINSGSEAVFMKLVLPKEKVYVGQTFAAQIQIFVRDDVQNFGNFELTSTPAEGMTIGRQAAAARAQTQIGNHAYKILPVAVALTATRAGALTLGPFTANAVIVLPSQNPAGDLVAQFFNQGERKNVSLVTEQVAVQSLPLPEQGRPADFNGAIGHYTMTMTAGPTNVTAGDPITVRLQVSGRGDLDEVKWPEPAWNDFKTFPPTQKTETSDPLGFEGKKTFEEIVTPQTSDVHELPAFSFSFFDPDDGQYHALSQPAIPLVVRSAGATPMPTLATTRSADNQAPPDILPIKQDLGRRERPGRLLITHPAFIAMQSVPVLAFLGVVAWRRRADQLANNPRRRRRLQVEKIVATGLVDLKRFAVENRPDEFFSTLFRLLQEQLGERLDRPASSITEAAVDEDLSIRGMPEPLLEEWRELFQLCNQARYAPVRGTGELNSIAEKFEKASHGLSEAMA